MTLRALRALRSLLARAWDSPRVPRWLAGLAALAAVFAFGSALAAVGAPAGPLAAERQIIHSTIADERMRAWAAGRTDRAAIAASRRRLTGRRGNGHRPAPARRRATPGAAPSEAELFGGVWPNKSLDRLLSAR